MVGGDAALAVDHGVVVDSGEDSVFVTTKVADKVKESVVEGKDAITVPFKGCHDTHFDKVE